MRPQPSTTLFPYTTLFRSSRRSPAPAPSCRGGCARWGRWRSRVPVGLAGAGRGVAVAGLAQAHGREHGADEDGEDEQRDADDEHPAPPPDEAAPGEDPPEAHAPEH